MRDIEILNVNETLYKIYKKIQQNNYIVDFVSYASVSEKNLEAAIFGGQFYGFFVTVEKRKDNTYLLTYKYHRKEFGER